VTNNNTMHGDDPSAKPGGIELAWLSLKTVEVAT
jgi:hypothetical protein